MTAACEILPCGVGIVDREGDIRPPHDDPDLTDCDGTALNEAAAGAIDAARKRPKRPDDYQARNRLLGEAIVEFGKANRLAGAGALYGAGDPRARGIWGARNATRESLEHRHEAGRLAALACAHCPLRESCSLGPEGLAAALSPTGRNGQGNRGRLREAIWGKGFDGLCADNMALGTSPHKKRRTS